MGHALRIVCSVIFVSLWLGLIGIGTGLSLQPGLLFLATSLVFAGVVCSIIYTGADAVDNPPAMVVLPLTATLSSVWVTFSYVSGNLMPHVMDAGMVAVVVGIFLPVGLGLAVYHYMFMSPYGRMLSARAALEEFDCGLDARCWIQLVVWSEDHAQVGIYFKAMSDSGRNPTYGEFHAAKRWVESQDAIHYA